MIGIKLSSLTDRNSEKSYLSVDLKFKNRLQNNFGNMNLKI